jgi:predicted Zn-dependent protease with MMP-like domain
MPDRLSEALRKEIFAALVEAQDQEMRVAESRHEIARRYGISEDDLREIERQGLDNDWPPFED